MKLQSWHFMVGILAVLTVLFTYHWFLAMAAQADKNAQVPQFKPAPEEYNSFEIWELVK